MCTVKATILKRFEEFKINGVSLLDKSSLKPSINSNATIVFLGPDRPWGELDEESKRFQTKIYNEYNHLIEVGRSILVNALPECKDKFEKEVDSILGKIEQKTYTLHDSIVQVTEDFKRSLENQIESVNSIYGKLGLGRVLIPDTNVFIANPDIHLYKIPCKSCILILPTILGELDKLKVEHGNENVRKKAAKTIKNLKEYRRRGKLLDGVKITDKLTAYTIAVEPKFEGKPSWLDPSNNDDRFIATCFEVAAKYPDSEMSILTLDINMQNKAEFALFPYVDPEENRIF
jgi:hypothetical protein